MHDLRFQINPQSQIANLKSRERNFGISPVIAGKNTQSIEQNWQVGSKIAILTT